ncbi:MAG: cation:proton antiporter [Candidatus Neomarinimicrobiota bacterium]|nr:cation:proton antiporter [Candidatus Neomarinimicrobiota bacterium]
METISTFVFSVGLIIFAAHFFTALFEKTRVPDVLPLIFIGILVGPLSGILSPNDFGYVGPLLSAVALTLMLFEGGSHLTLETLKNSLKDSVILALTTFIITVMISSCIAYYFMGKDIIPALFIGSILGSISPAVVVPIVRMLNLSENTKSMLVVESAITDVLSIIIALAILKTFQAGHNSIMEFIGTDLIATMAMSLLLGFGGAVIWSTILEKIRKFPNTIFTTLAFIFLLYGSSEILGYSGPISVLIFGVVLANSKKIPLDIVQRFGADHLTEFTSIEKTLFSEVIFLVKTFFFIFLGISIQFSNVKIMIMGLILTLAIYSGRLILCKFLIPKNTHVSETAMISFMIPKGLAAAVLAEVPMHMGLPIEAISTFTEIRSIIYIVILLSILLTAILIYGQESGVTQKRYEKFFSNYN